MVGKVISEEEAMSEGNAQCSICMDTIHTPVVLPCKHVFCDNCISSWLEMNSTCPLCRKPIRQHGDWLHANGSSTLFPIVFFSVCSKSKNASAAGFEPARGDPIRFQV